MGLAGQTNRIQIYVIIIIYVIHIFHIILTVQHMMQQIATRMVIMHIHPKLAFFAFKVTAKCTQIRQDGVLLNHTILLWFRVILKLS